MKLPPDITPSTLDEAVGLIVGSMSETDKEYVRGEKDSCSVHHSVGRGIRNRWIHSQTESPLREWFRTELKLIHPDDISGVIMEAVWCKIRGKSFDAAALSKKYIAHWKAEGYDPMTGESTKKFGEPTTILLERDRKTGDVKRVG